MTDTTIGNEIAKQIGGRAFYMLGASRKPLVAIDRGLQFSVGRNAKRVTHVRIVLTDADLYDVEFSNVSMRRKEMVKILETVEGVYVDQLHSVIENATGLYISL